MNEKRLTEIFRMAGARDPEGWARSEATEDIPQLARYLFLRAAWRGVVSDGDTSWIESYLKIPSGPGAGIVPALTRLLEHGVDREDLTEVVRVMQWTVLDHMCQLLDEAPLAVDDLQTVPELADYKFGWGLFEVDVDENPGRPIGCLHESVLETEPSGREMCPRR